MAKVVRSIGLLVAMVSAMMCAPAGAHHSFAVFFDSDTGIVSVRGKVTDFKFTNPHGIIRVDVKGKDGSVQVWKAETNSPSILERRGWKKDSLKVGDEIVLEGWRARDGSNYMRMRKVTHGDGTRAPESLGFLDAGLGEARGRPGAQGEDLARCGHPR
jgi:hypothetical protein